ncbi:MAG TPA: hypothetical protein VII33_02750, partial [Nakamurella sp.]
VYTGGPDFFLEEPTEVTASAAEVLLRAFTDGDAALRSLDPGQMPILWPEHFDIGISAAEVNYGVSPGDALIGEPYAYVGPWQVPTGAFWNQPFGAARPLSRLPSPQAILEFFLEARLAAHLDVLHPGQPGQVPRRPGEPNSGRSTGGRGRRKRPPDG